LIAAMKKHGSMSYSIISILAFSLILSQGYAQTAEETDTEKCARKIRNNCVKCVYTVNAYLKIDSNGSGTPQARWKRNVGTAIPIDDEGYLITLRNVVENAEKVKVVSSSGEKIEARVVGSDYTGCISVLKIDRRFVRFVPNIIPLKTLTSGNKVFFLGVVPGMLVDVSCGIISRVMASDGTFEVKGDDIPKTSGTPVFDRDENVLGLLAYQIKQEGASHVRGEAERKYLIISHEHAAVLARHVISNNRPSCGWLGVCIDLTSSNGSGILITDVIEGSPAEKSDIRPNDIICEYNGHTISSPSQFSDYFSRTRAGDTVTIKLIRGNRHISVDVKLAGR